MADGLDARGALGLAQVLESQGARTVGECASMLDSARGADRREGVLVNPDKVCEGEEHGWVKILEGSTCMLKRG